MKVSTFTSSIILMLPVISISGCHMNSISPANTMPQGSGTSGAETVPTISLSTSNLIFANTPVGATAAAQTVTLKNTGNGALDLSGSGMGISITGTNSSSYSQTNQCGTSVSAGASCTVTITFTPTVSGTLSAVLSIADNATESPQTILLSSTGTAPVVSLSSPASVVFEDTVVGAAAATQAVTLKNTGNEALDLSGSGMGISITGTNSSSYSQTNQCGTNVSAGASCTVTITFTPAVSGTLRAVLSIADNAADSPQTVGLVGPGAISVVSSSSNIYYVDNTIPDIHIASSAPDCTTYNPVTSLCNGGTAIAYSTIADVNALKLHPGDQVLFRRGEIWREQLSRSLSNQDVPEEPITFGSYGDASSPLPIIDGANLLSDWTSYEVSSSGSTATVYSAPYTAIYGNGYNFTSVPYAKAPNQVIEDGKYLSQNTSSYEALEAGQWYLDTTSSKVWVRLTGDDDPGEHTIEASQRDYSIEIYVGSYLRIFDLQTEGASNTGLNFGAGNDNNIVVSGVVARNNHNSGIAICDSANFTIKSSTIANNGGIGIFLFQTSNVLIDGNDIHDNGLLSSSGWAGGIKGDGPETTNTIVQNNRIYSNGVPNGVQALRGIDFDTVGDGAVIRYNEIYSNTFDGIELDAGSDAAVYGNLIYKNGNFGVRAFADWQTSMTGVLVYNNTVYGNQNGGIKLMGPTGSAHGTCTNNAVINNIVVNTIDGPNLAVSKGCENLTEAAGDSGSGNIYTFNALGVASKKFIQWGSASESTYEAWETAAGNCGEKGCSHSVESDPLLTSASLNDFTLSSNSPAIGVGLNLGELYEEGLSTTSSWPSDVLLNNQNESTGGWSIGAYTYP